MSRISLTLFMLSFACTLSAGCGPRDKVLERVIVSGEVTWQGLPLETGNLTIIPVQSNPAPPSGAEILEGKFRVVNKGGVVPGEYRVEITADRIIEGKRATNSEYVPTEQLIPAKYNTASTLTLTVPSGKKEFQQSFALVK